MKKGLLRGVYLGVLFGILLGNTSLAAEKFIKVDKIDGFKLEIGAVLPQKFLAKNKSAQTVRISATQTVPGYNIKSEEIRFKIGVDGSNTIIFIYCDDPAFVTPERIRPGMDFKDALKGAPQASVILERGWIGYLPFTSGWNAAVLLDDREQWSFFDKIAFVFKRKQ